MEMAKELFQQMMVAINLEATFQEEMEIINQMEEAIMEIMQQVEGEAVGMLETMEIIQLVEMEVVAMVSLISLVEEGMEIFQAMEMIVMAIIRLMEE